MIYIRADMNQTIATGHMMRCLSIADAARKIGEEVMFILADENACSLLQARGYSFHVLGTDWEDKEAELPTLLKWIEDNGVKQLLIDSYQITPRYLEILKGVVQIAYIDDLNAFPYPVDLLICYANYYHKFAYHSYLSKQQLCLGTKYAPLREVFADRMPKEIKPKVENLLVMSGGSDPIHFLINFLERLDKEGYQHIHVICGAFYERYDEICEKYAGYRSVHLHRSVSNLEDYMQEADLAITAGGSTMYELCACGTPAISYAFADNQLDNVMQFQEDGLIDYAGDLRKDDAISNILHYLQKYDQNETLRRERSRGMQALVDGKGARRIVQRLCDMRAVK